TGPPACARGARLLRRAYPPRSSAGPGRTVGHDQEPHSRRHGSAARVFAERRPGVSAVREMTCDAALELLAIEAIEGPGDQQQALDAHCGGCLSCARVRDDYRR